MDKEIKITNSELKKTSLDFRMVANRLIRTKPEEGMSNLKRFIDYIDNNPILSHFIQKYNGSIPILQEDKRKGRVFARFYRE